MSAEDTLTTLEATKTEPTHTFGPTQNMHTLCAYNSHHHRRRRHLSLRSKQGRAATNGRAPNYT